MVYLMMVAYQHHVVLICLSDDIKQVEQIRSTVHEEDPDWTVAFYARPSIGASSERHFRALAADGVAFVGTVAVRLGIAVDLQERSAAMERYLQETEGDEHG